MESAPSPFSGLLRDTRSKRRSPIYPSSRRPSPGAESMAAPSRTTKTNRSSLRGIPDDDDSDLDDAPPQLSAVAEMLLTGEKGPTTMGNGIHVEVPRTAKKLQWGTAPEIRTIERRSPISGSSTGSRTSPSYPSRMNEVEPVTPAPKSRTRPIGRTLSSSGSNDSSDHKEPDFDSSYYTGGMNSAVRPPAIVTATTPAARWKRPTALAGAPRRGPIRDNSVIEEDHDENAGMSPVDHEDEAEEREHEAERDRERSGSAGYRIKSRESTSGSFERRGSQAHSREYDMDPPQRPSPEPRYTHREPSPVQKYTARGPSPIEQHFAPREESPPPEPKASSTIPLRPYIPTIPSLPSLPVRNKENVAPAAVSRAASYQPRGVNDNNMLANSPSRKRPTRVPSPEVLAEQPAAFANRNSNVPLRSPPPPPPKMSMMEATKTTDTVSATLNEGPKKARQNFIVNGRAYQRLMSLGKGGSAKVYKVIAESGRMFALKKVQFHPEDGEAAIAGYKGEINLLKKLNKVDRVIRLWDSEINEKKQCLLMLMECGETDLAKLLGAKNSGEDAKLDMITVRFYWREMLECVKAVHDLNIIHSDLKPANFLVVNGRLKLIDFGIANAIQDDTVNVHRESQVGTVNYMAPETLLSANAAGDAKLHKLGAPSDVWSLGCILYQMIYGRTPFAHVSQIYEKVKAITKPSHPEYNIRYPPVGIGEVPVPLSVVKTIQGCLRRNKEERPTIPELLSDKDQFLNPDYRPDGAVDINMESLKILIKNTVKACANRSTPDDSEIDQWAKNTYDSLMHRMFEAAEYPRERPRWS